MNGAGVEAALSAAPVVAILRGLPTQDAVAVVEALYDAGVRVAEVPLNSPDPFATIALLRAHFGTRMVIGAGTVVDPTDVDRLADVGGQICVAPNCDTDVIARAGTRAGSDAGRCVAQRSVPRLSRGCALAQIFPHAASWARRRSVPCDR